MRISIVGAPGSGKNNLMDALEKVDDLNDHTFLRTPIAKLAEQGRGVGSSATYNEHIFLYALHQREIDMVKDDMKVVQSGTVLQRLAHLAAIHDDRVSDWSGGYDRAETLFRVRPAIEIFTALTMDTYRNDLTALVLRPIPLDIIGDMEYDDSVQYHLQDAMDQMQIPYRMMTGTVEEQVEGVVEAMNEYAAADIESS